LGDLGGVENHLIKEETLPPVVSIVGKSDSGKTVFLEKLIRELTSRGYRIATIKHSHHAIEFEKQGKDSWRHAQAGSLATVTSATNAISIVKATPQEPTIADIARAVGEDYDLVLTEGFSRGDAPKIEVHRKGVGPLLQGTKSLIAVATDEPVETKARQFSLEDAKGVADLLETGFIKPNKERISLWVNGESVPLSEFPRQIIINTLIGMAKSLKGVNDIKSLDISLRKG